MQGKPLCQLRQLCEINQFRMRRFYQKVLADGYGFDPSRFRIIVIQGRYGFINRGHVVNGEAMAKFDFELHGRRTQWRQLRPLRLPKKMNACCMISLTDERLRVDLAGKFQDTALFVQRHAAKLDQLNLVQPESLYITLIAEGPTGLKLIRRSGNLSQ